MKRQLLLTLSLLVFTLLLGIACEYGSHYIAVSFQNDILPIQAALADENWEEALRLTETLHFSWKSTSRLVQLWINHGDIDHVTACLLDLRAALITQDLTAALTASSQCAENFGHLHHRDAFTLRNIL